MDIKPKWETARNYMNFKEYRLTREDFKALTSPKGASSIIIETGSDETIPINFTTCGCSNCFMITAKTMQMKSIHCAINYHMIKRGEETKVNDK